MLKHDLTGRRFGKMLILSRASNGNQRQVRWNCVCDCGNQTISTSQNLLLGIANSCGCDSRRRFKAMITKHGTHGTKEYALWRRAKTRARRWHRPFNIEPSDIVIPERCPVFGMPLVAGRNKAGEDSPSLDRVIPELGYVKGNVWVISLKANKCKAMAGPNELRALLDAINIFINNT